MLLKNNTYVKRYQNLLFNCNKEFAFDMCAFKFKYFTHEIYFIVCIINYDRTCNSSIQTGRKNN